MEDVFTLEFCLVMQGGSWLRCRATSTHRRLVDLLNANANRPFLVQVDSITAGSPEAEGVSRGVDALASVNPRSIVFGLPVENLGLVPRRKSPDWSEKVKRPVRIGVGSYDIRGNIHAPKAARQVEESVTGISGFFAVTEAIIRRDAGFPFERRVVIVNSDPVDFISHERAVDEPAFSQESVLAVGV
ncbi:MAG: hypothetical protein ACYC4L_08620 [Chloroflexota bacterium]